MANLADVAGRVSISATATTPEGYDKGKLENGVFEPLRELAHLYQERSRWGLIWLVGGVFGAVRA